MISYKITDLAFSSMTLHKAFSPYHQGPIFGPVPNPIYPPFFPIFKINSQSEAKKLSLFTYFDLFRYVEIPTQRPWLSCKQSQYYKGLELAIDPPPPPPRGNFVHYDFLKLHYIRHKVKDVSPMRVAALTCNITLYMLPPKIALNVPDNVSTMTCSYIFAC